MDTLTVTILASVVFAGFYVYFSRRTSDPYGTFHVPFNKVPGGPDPPQTEWLNMGFWKVLPRSVSRYYNPVVLTCDRATHNFVALAIQLFRVADLKPGGRVLDVGHGCGDSILLQLSHPEVATPSILCGITSLPAHHRRSWERVKIYLSSVDAPPAVLLFQGDAVWRPGCQDHPLSPNFKHDFDNILALDCAYHFNTREEFLRQSLRRLTPGGSVALADLCFSSSPGPVLTLLLWRVLRTMPKRNITTKEQYIQQMREIGYEDVELEDITPFVFPGFRQFLKQRGRMWSIFSWSMSWLEGQGLRFVIIKGTRPNTRPL
ncbi:S-adenosyl-L-methionine-dependent methyltransferase [Lactarius hatsudake]|nr:S-adenosyl-L-methionine-dependent methyltransferase [Lactarius hatsudake]